MAREHVMEHTGLEVLLMWLALGFNIWVAKECFVKMEGVFAALLVGLNAGAAFGNAVGLFMLFFSIN